MKKAPVTAMIAAAILAAAALAAPAGGAGPSVGVGYDGGDARASALSLEITGTTEADEIALSLDPSQTEYVLTSNHSFDPPAPPCTQSSPRSFEIRCPADQFAGFTALLLQGNDTFTVGQSVRAITSLMGHGGLDDLIGGGGADSLVGGTGADRLVGNKGQDTLIGGKNGDILNGGKGRDTLKGGKGDDKLRGGPGRDTEKQ